MKMSPVVHFEMPYEDKNRVTEFYARVFGWHSQPLGPEMGNYITVDTTERDEETSFPKEPGRINGGLFEKSNENQYPSIVIAVDDIYQSIESVEEAGGKVIGGQNSGEPDDIPGIGLYISFNDTEGNRVSMLQPAPVQGATSNE